MALLRWWRFLRAVGVGWDQATRAEARDFWSWIQLAGKPGAAALALSRRRRAGDGDGAGGDRDAEPGDGEAFCGAGVCHGDGGALRERAAWFL